MRSCEKLPAWESEESPQATKSGSLTTICEIGVDHLIFVFLIMASRRMSSFFSSLVIGHLCFEIHICLAILLRAIFLRRRPKSSVCNASASAIKCLFFSLLCTRRRMSRRANRIACRRDKNRKRAHVHTVAAFSSLPSNVAASLITKVFLWLRQFF